MIIYKPVKARPCCGMAKFWRFVPMNTLTLVITILQLLCAGLSGSIGGVADSFLARNKAKTMDAKLARATKWVGAVFLILTLILLILQGRAA